MERISVLVRVRPLDKQEAVKGIPWKITGNTICLSNQGPKFEFDRVFGEDSKTVDIYEARTKDIVAAAVRGFNGTVFAYGQTSSGKTHTMRGSSTEPGVIPLAVHEVFKNIQELEGVSLGHVSETDVSVGHVLVNNIGNLNCSLMNVDSLRCCSPTPLIDIQGGMDQLEAKEALSFRAEMSSARVGAFAQSSIFLGVGDLSVVGLPPPLCLH
eukprot:Gb_12655 [translate_table: standard]